MGLTPELSRAAKRRRLGRLVRGQRRPLSHRRRQPMSHRCLDLRANERQPGYQPGPQHQPLPQGLAFDQVPGERAKPEREKLQLLVPGPAK